MVASVSQLPLQPHSVEAEQAVLGSLLLDGGKVWPLIAPLLAPSDFFRADHRLIFETLAELAVLHEHPDAVTLFANLERKKLAGDAGGLAYLSRLARETSTGANAEQYAKVVRDRAQLRTLADIGRQLETSAVSRGTSAEQLTADLERMLSDLRKRSRSGDGLKRATDLGRELIDDLERRREGAGGLSTGLADFDELTGGLEAGELTIFAGRPGVGKTALLVTICAHVAREIPVAVFSAEMPSLQLSRRFTALLGNIDQTVLRRPKHMTDHDWERVAEATAKFSERRLWVDERVSPSTDYIRAQCVRQKARHGLGLVLVDYCQLVEGRGEKRADQQKDVAYGCKNLAKEIGVPVVLLSQVNRDVEKRENKRPRMSDLRESGGIEEAGDLVGMLYCESYYKPDFDMPNIVECSIEKTRHGERAKCLWHFAGEYSRMTALDDAGRCRYRALTRGAS